MPIRLVDHALLHIEHRYLEARGLHFNNEPGDVRTATSFVLYNRLFYAVYTST